MEKKWHATLEIWYKRGTGKFLANGDEIKVPTFRPMLIKCETWEKINNFIQETIRIFATDEPDIIGWKVDVKYVGEESFILKNEKGAEL